jgi:hypothetical protein
MLLMRRFKKAANTKEELSQNTNEMGTRENYEQDVSASPCESLQQPAEICYNIYPDKDLSQNGEDRTRTYPENKGNSQFFVEGAAKSGAVADVGVFAADLARIVAAWPLLPTPIRRAMLALLDCER